MRADRGRRAPQVNYVAGPHPSPWKGVLTTLDILLNNFGVGLFLIAAVGLLVAHDEFVDVAGVAFPLAFAIIAVDLLLLVSDLGDPFRFFHMLRVIKPRTPMSVGVWSLSILMILLVPVVAISVIGWFTTTPTGLETAVTVIAAIALVPGFGAIAYKGPLFSVTAQPGWRDARWLGAHICSSGPAHGSSVLLLIAVVGDRTGAVAGLQATTLALLAICAVALVMLRRDLDPELRLRRSVRREELIHLAIVVTGFVVPIALLLVGTTVVTCALAAVSLLATNFAVRLIFVSIPHRPLLVPADREPQLE